ncbi:CPA2 family monovalent cation:H+ antiporter-2/trk system potassium uptake protein TrkA [Lactobacillus colini]|uniref:CPA2 family monovalent cation:H+ antiporter-2/trk system potassium uptake protein TrkA n=2 Tax=Lactobacillus colini TaxID=1819254 RepID=A0ABS4MDF1_9LACO|nr:cation:proton antiporter family protein [Lactobacillus colini]MBP2057407.1 CPA2 family monovalent cation:H+ antiporter-2/trk system potassium uptake protein TrkA [Lactobacillus colini]
MEQLSIFIVALAALTIPILMARLNISTIPTAVAEIIAGIILGKSFLNIIASNSEITMLSNLGVTLLMFLSGMEINFSLFKRDNKKKKSNAKEVNPPKVAILSFVLVVIFAAILAIILKLLGLFSDIMLATIIFSTVALGIVIATLKEKEILSRPIGQTILLTAVLGEVVPLLLLTIYASINGGNAGQLWLIVLLFVAAIFLLNRFRGPYHWFNKISKSTTQLDIRLAFFLIFTLVTVAERVGAENILGAFLAGMVMKLLEPSEATMDKLTSIGYGFFIPVFFIMTGVNLNLRSLLTNPSALMLIPILVIFLLVAKLPVFVVYRRNFNLRNSWAGTFLVMTTITIVLPTLQVARKLHAISATQSDAFTLAAVIVCILGPILFNARFKLTIEDKIKERVNIIGTNLMTVPVAQELRDNWYNVKMFTHLKNNYDTYKSRVAKLTLVDEMNESSLEKSGAFNADLLVAGLRDDEDNIRIGHLAKTKGVKRVIVSLINPTPERVKRVADQGIEVFNQFNVETSVLRSLIESPSILKILNDTQNGLYEVTVRNHRYTGQKLMNLEFIDKMTISRIRRDDKWLTPHGNTIIEPGDHVIFTAKVKDVTKIREELGREN